MASTTSSSSSGTTTATIFSNPEQNLFNGLMLFFIGMFFIVWFFRGKITQ